MRIPLSTGIAIALLLLGPLFVSPPSNGPPETASDTELPLDLAFDDGSQKAEEILASMDGSFLENLGQLDNADVRFYARGCPLSVGLTPWGAIYTVREVAEQPRPEMASLEPASARATSFEVSFERCNDVEPVGVGRLGHPTNFFIGNDESRWVRGAGSFEEVVYEDLWDGIDLVYYFKDGMLKYDLVVDEGADPDDIVFSYLGIEALAVDHATGTLQIRTVFGVLEEKRPVLLGCRYGEVLDLASEFVLSSDSSVGFDIPGPSLEGRSFIIDPGLIWSTLIGGGSNDYITPIVLDENEDLYCAGSSSSWDFPTTPGAYQETKDGYADVFLLKLASNGSSLLMATFVGGDLSDHVDDMSISPDGDVCIVGTTTSYDFPITEDAIFKEIDGDVNCFILMMSSDGSTLKYSSLLVGGSMNHVSVTTIRHHTDRTVYMMGFTDSPNLPKDPWAYCATRSRSRHDIDAFVIRLDSTLTKVLNATYLGGSSDDFYIGIPMPPEGCLDIDKSGNVFVTGSTVSEDFPTTQGAVQQYTDGSVPDGFISKLDGNLSTLLRSTYIGGNEDDSISSLIVDNNGTIYATGQTVSSDFPTTPDALNPTIYSADYADAFLLVLDNELSSLVYSTFLGGRSPDVGDVLALGPNEKTIYVIGGTQTQNLTITEGGYDSIFRGVQDTFLWVFDLGTMNLTYSTYIGGCDVDFCMDIVADSNGTLYLGMVTESWDIFTTSGAYGKTFRGSRMGYLLKLDPRPCSPPEAPTDFNIRPVPGHNGWIICFGWTDPEFNGSRIGWINYYYSDSSNPGEWVCYMKSIWCENCHKNDSCAMAVISHESMGYLIFDRITLVNSAGEGEPSNIAQYIIVIPPSAPMGLSASANLADGTVNLTWFPPEDPGTINPLNYIVLRGLSPSTMTELANLSNVTDFVDRTVVTGEEYYYAIIASNERGEGPRSSVVSIIPKKPPEAPQSFEAIPGDMRVHLSWASPWDDGGSLILGYRLFRGTSPLEFNSIADLQVYDRRFLDTGLVNGMVYFYYLIAYTEVAPGPRTEILNVTPFTVPSAPLNLVAESMDSQVVLDWEPPERDGGLPIEGYLIQFGPSKVDLPYSIDLANLTAFTHTDLTNGDTYWYRIVAYSEAGFGSYSDLVCGLPIGLPGPPEYFMVRFDTGSAKLSWSNPQDSGGATSLTYQILRGLTKESLETLVVLQDTYSYTDTTVVPGYLYYYAIRAENSMGVGDRSSVQTLYVLDRPGPVENLIGTSGDGWIRLSWSPPIYDGGADITEYMLFKGTVEASLQEFGTMGLALEYHDTDVDNGQAYYYAVCALNVVGRGELSVPMNATPYSPPNCPILVRANIKGEGVELTWQEPIPAGNAPVTGYIVLRGDNQGILYPIADLSSVLSYMDDSVDEGKTYYYQVIAKSDMGSSPPSTVQKVTVGTKGTIGVDFLVLGIVLLALIGIGLVLGFTMVGRRGRVGVDGGSEVPEDLTSEVSAISVTSTSSREAVILRPYLVEEVFVFHKDGRLVTSCVREEDSGQDGEMMSGMLIAVQGIIQDGLQLGGTLEGIKYGDNSILMATGDHVILAAVIYGQPNDDLRDTLEATVRFVETTYAGVIEEWTGELEISSGVEDLVKPILGMTGGLTREDVEADTVPQVVSLLSAVDFFRGYVRLKVAAVNSTTETIVDTAIELRYDRHMLRMEWVEPGSLKLKGDRVNLGNVKPRERKTVAFMFDPQICQETDIYGTLTYYDSHGEFRSEEMKRRRAEIVCPVFTSVASANTAMLRRLVKDTLHQSDNRVLVYPSSLTPHDVLRLGKEVLDMSDLQLVHEYVSEGPPLEIETWYYGVTRVKGYQMVMRLGVVERKCALELFVASTSMEPVTGLFAEFRRELERLYKEEYPIGDELEPNDDEEVRRSVADRELLIDKEISG